jgi:2-polyprenyl-3-methyl-5-hydroxy-6-metoxy-1,4-benzoquinol methylase
MDVNSIKQELIDFSNKRPGNNKFIDYADYVNYQIGPSGLSFERDHPRWSNGQRICIEQKFSDLDRSLRVLDICCGDGVGLEKLLQMGFKNITGVEIADQKIEIAKNIHNNVLKRDICCGPFDLGEKYDVIYSSHTIEHLLNPEFSIKNILSYLKDDGIFFLVLPYPEFQGGDPTNDHNFKAHCGVIPLGLHINDEGKTTSDIITKMGFKVIEVNFYNYRENEIHLKIKKQ